MQEVVDPLLAATAVVVRLRLSQLIVMMREAQILTPAVDVYLLPNDSAGHGRALYVPPCQYMTPELTPQVVEPAAGNDDARVIGGNIASGCACV